MKSEQTFWQKIKRFFEPMKYLKIEYSKEIFKAVFTAINAVIHILFLERIVSAIEQGNTEFFSYVLGVYAGYIIFFELVHTGIRKWGWINTLPLASTYNYRDYLAKYIGMDNNKIELLGTGKLVGIISEGNKVWVNLISDMIEKGSAITVTVIFSLYMIMRVDLWYGGVFIIFMILFLLLIIWINKKLAVFRSRRYEYRNTRLRRFVKIMMSKNEILQTGNIDNEVDALHRNSIDIRDVSIEMVYYRTIMKRAAPLVLSILTLLVFWILGKQVLAGEATLSTLVGLTGTLIIMQRAISDTTAFYVEFSKQFISVEKLWDFFDTTPQITGYEEGNTFEYKTGSIELRNINYSYDTSKPVFTDLSLTLQGKKITALVGPSGGGKSTLVKLISGYIKANSGEILVDNQKLSETSLKSYYKSVGYLTQEPSVFDGSVRENLMYGIQSPHPNPLAKGEGIDAEDLGESGDKLKNIITLAHCEFIYDLPNGLDTEIGERGVKLSGGQKQRLAIAKIFLKDPKIIILDEPTSALDSVSEKKITEAMHNLFKNRTVIVIAHRLQTVKHADDILVIGNGEVIERGTHTELTKLGGFYKEMLDLQSGF